MVSDFLFTRFVNYLMLFSVIVWMVLRIAVAVGFDRLILFRIAGRRDWLVVFVKTCF